MDMDRIRDDAPDRIRKIIVMMLAVVLLTNIGLYPAPAQGSEGSLEGEGPLYTAGVRLHSSLPGSFSSVSANRSGDYLFTAILPDPPGAGAPADTDVFSADAFADETRGQNAYFMKFRENRQSGKIEPVWIQALFEVPNSAKPYAGYYNLQFNDSVQLAGGGYAVVGYGSPSSVYYSVYESQPILLRDLQGYERIISHQHVYGSESNDDALVVRVDELGMIHQVVTRSVYASEKFTSVDAAPDGGFAAAGSSASGALLVKYDRNGQQEWESGLAGGAGFTSVAAVADGGFIVSGQAEHALTAVSLLEPEKQFQLPGGGFLARFDGEGRVLWVSAAEGTRALNDVIALKDGRYVAAGNQDNRIVMVKYDEAGNLLASATMTGGEQAADYLASVVPAQEGGYLFAGLIQSPGAEDYQDALPGREHKGGTDWAIIKTDDNLNREWVYFAGGSGIDTGGAPALADGPGHMLAASETGLVVAGASASLDGDWTNIKPPYNSDANAAALSFSFDWDGDGVVNARDYYPGDGARILPSADDMKDIDYDMGPSVTLAAYADLTDLYPYSALDNIAVLAGEDVFMAPAVVFANMMRGGYQFSLKQEEPSPEELAAIASTARPETRRSLRTVKLSASLSGYPITAFGAYIGITLSVPGLADPENANLYELSPGSARLQKIESAQFGEDSVSFIAGQLSTYVIDELIDAELALVDSLIEQIDVLPFPDQLSIADKNAVLAACQAFEELPEEQREMISAERLIKLYILQVYMEELMEADGQSALNAVIVRIEALPAAVSLGLKSQVQAARAAYEALEAPWKALVPKEALEKLAAAERSIAGMEAIANTPLPSIQVRDVSDYPDIPGDLYLLSSVRYLYPQGNVIFDKSRSISASVSYDPSIIPDGYEVDIYYYDGDKKKWIAAGGSIAGGVVYAKVGLFEPFAVFAKSLESFDGNAGGYNPLKLKDIAGHWAEEDIRTLVAAGIISGYSDGTFWPDWIITRAELVVMLVRSLGLQAEGEAQFSDTAGHWAEEPVRIAAASGMVSGYGDGTFRPDNPVTREEMAVLLFNAFEIEAAGSSEISFADGGHIAQWAARAVGAMAHSGILKGTTGNQFRPKEPATRAEAAAVLVRALVARESGESEE